ncbi:MAG: sigma-70 family RNA polymerase sigma factor [Acidimicrobiia bacterium]|nr:sigma-70 family RNA polymerase sigma factor [Acidimicrobiia bacterium]
MVADPEADLEQVFRSAYPGVVRTVSLIVGDRETAREIAQDAFVQLVTHWEKVRRFEQIGAWVRRVAIRLAVRHRARPRPALLPDRGSRGSDAIDRRLDLERALGELSKAQRVAVVLHYLEDLPVSEVAAALGCSSSTARVHLHRGRQRLGELLEGVRDDVPR